MDNLNRPDLGGDIHQNNPCEELNLLQQDSHGNPGYYGYPKCWSVLDLEGYEPLTQMAQPEFMPSTTDEWCQQNSIPPVMGFGAHQAPLDMIFWKDASFGSDMVGDAFVGFHGSWNRVPAAGYCVRRVLFDANSNPVDHYEFLRHTPPDAYESRWMRPVGLTNYVHNDVGCMLITSDSNSKIYIVCPKQAFL